MDDRQLLMSVEMLSGLTDSELDELQALTGDIQLRRNEVLFSEHDEADCLFVVRDGRLAIVRDSFDGRESVLALLTAGDLVGEMPLFDGAPRSAKVKALEPTSLVKVPYEPLRRMYTARPELLWGAVSLLASRLRTMDDALADTMFLDVAGRTAKKLLEMAGDEDEFQLPVTQEELAQMVGASRERVNKALSSFNRLGWLEQRERTYLITNRDALTQRSL
ncbi:MAG: Crp/Fnr family transcriptional regulator [Acidimicrobiales bacterium]